MILSLLLGCQTVELSEEWQLDRLRLLAVRAEPAEPVPGDVVTFTSLSYVPGSADWSALWIACVEGDEDGCTFDEALMARLEDAASLTEEELAQLVADLQAAGLIGLEPMFSPAWTVPGDALDGLDDAAALEGLAATVQVTLSTEADTELALRRVPVSRATTPNHNPDIGALEVDEVGVDASFAAARGEAYTLTARLDGGLETYTYVTTGGVEEERTEEPEWRWYAEGGQLSRGGRGPDFGGDPEDFDEITWTAPDAAGEYLLHAVVLDGRGGMGWWTLTATVD